MKTKCKRHISCEQNKNQGIPIIVEEERWDANRGILKLRCLSILEIFTWDTLCIPKLELLPLLILLILVAPRSSNTSYTQNITKNLVRFVSTIKQITTFRYYCKLIPISYQHYIYYIPTSPWFIPPDTTHRFIKISEEHIENRICQKQDSLQQSGNFLYFCNIKTSKKLENSKQSAEKYCAKSFRPV